MPCRLPDLIDIPKLQLLMDQFHAATGIPVGILGCDGKILVATGWQEISTGFHRSHPVTAERCRQSDDYIKSRPLSDDYVAYKCRNGLWDIAKPIVIAGEHCATLYLCQFFYDDEEVDEEFFRKQALEFGFDAGHYLAALRKIPIFTREKVRQIMEYYNSFLDFIVSMGWANYRQRETAARLKESEEALKSSEAEKSLILNSTIDLVVYHDSEMKVLWGNKRALDSVGMRKEELIGRHCWEIWHGRSEPCDGCPVIFALDTGEPREGEIRSPDGREWYIRGFPVKDDGGRVMGAVEFCLEITARKRAEYALLENERVLESEKRFRSLFEHMLEGVAYCRMLYDENGRPADFVYLDVNSAYSELTGLQDVIGRKVSEVLPGVRESDPGLLELYGRVASTGQPEKCDIYIKQLSLWRSMSVYSTEIGFFVAVSENITERKRIEADLQESHHKLRELAAHMNQTREREQKSFARKVHDELGTSLTVLKFDLAWLKRNYPADEKAVSERIRAMDELIHECTLTVQRITSELRPSLLDEQGLAATIEWQAKEFGKRSGISCMPEIDNSIPSLSQDKTINVFRIFQQSLSNVLQHAGATRVFVSLAQTSRDLLLRITDNGVGIRDHEISAATSFGILGMKERARLCDGIISIKGAEGKGTTISLSIPFDDRGSEECSTY